MPPKAKPKPKGKRKSKTDKRPKDNKDQLWRDYASLQEELDKVLTEKRNFRIEMLESKRSLDHSQRNLEQTKARVQGNLLLRRKMEKQHQVEIDEQELKVNQLRESHHREIAALKLDAASSRSKIQKDHVETEVKLQTKLHLIKADKEEKHHQSSIYYGKLKLQQHDELQELNNNYEQKVIEMQEEYRTKIDNLTRGQKKMLREIYEEWEQKCVKIEAEQKQETEIDTKLKILQKESIHASKFRALKVQCEKLKSDNKDLDSWIAARKETNRRLKAKEADVMQRLSQSREMLVTEKNNWSRQLKMTEWKSKLLSKDIQELSANKVTLQLQCEQVQQEIEALQRKHDHEIVSTQQRSSLRFLLLTQKIKALRRHLQDKEAELSVALDFGRGVETSHDKEHDDLVEKTKGLMGLSTKQSLAGYDDDNVASAQLRSENLVQTLKSLDISETSSTQSESRPSAAASKQPAAS